MLASVRRRLTARTVLAVLLQYLILALLWSFHRLFDDAFVHAMHELYSRYATRWIANTITWYVENTGSGVTLVSVLAMLLLWIVSFVDDRILAREFQAGKTSAVPLTLSKPTITSTELSHEQKLLNDAVRPEVIPFLDVPPRATAYGGPLMIENSGSVDAFNIEIGNISNGRSIATFSAIDRLKPGAKEGRTPFISGSPTSNGSPDLYRFARQGQMGTAWDTIVNDKREVPPGEIEELVRQRFVAPFHITYEDSLGRRWVTRAEFVYGEDNTGWARLAIKFKGIDSRP
jgi:hypothetical protein